MAGKQTHAEFQARMDRARDEDYANLHAAAALAVVVSVLLALAAYYLAQDVSRFFLFFFAGGNLLLTAVAVRLLYGIHKSRTLRTPQE